MLFFEKRFVALCQELPGCLQEITMAGQEAACSDASDWH
jgi:hypothetical protein